jgi:hypothetical protein
MKKPFLFSILSLWSVFGLSQELSVNENQILVSIKGTEESMLVNTIDLIGVWRNISSTLPIVGSNVPKANVEISNGNMVAINDAWKEDYPNKLRNCTWRVVDKELQFQSPDLGEVSVEIEKLKDSNFFELTINTFTYRKLVNLSSN